MYSNILVFWYNIQGKKKIDIYTKVRNYGFGEDRLTLQAQNIVSAILYMYVQWYIYACVIHVLG